MLWGNSLGKGDKKRQRKWIKCKRVEKLLLFLHVVEFGGSFLLVSCSRNIFSHENLFTRDFSFNTNSFLFYLQGCCSMYACVCIINGRCGICRNWCTRRRYLRSGARPLGRNSRHQLWAVQTPGRFPDRGQEDFNFFMLPTAMPSSPTHFARKGEPIDRFACCVEWILPVSWTRPTGSTRGRSRRSTWLTVASRLDSNTRFEWIFCAVIGARVFVV